MLLVNICPSIRVACSQQPATTLVLITLSLTAVRHPQLHYLMCCQVVLMSHYLLIYNFFPKKHFTLKTKIGVFLKTFLLSCS